MTRWYLTCRYSWIRIIWIRRICCCCSSSITSRTLSIINCITSSTSYRSSIYIIIWIISSSISNSSCWISNLNSLLSITCNKSCSCTIRSCICCNSSCCTRCTSISSSRSTRICYSNSIITWIYNYSSTIRSIIYCIGRNSSWSWSCRSFLDKK